MFLKNLATGVGILLGGILLWWLIYGSAWVDYGVPRYLVKYYSEYDRESFSGWDKHLNG